MNHSLDDSWKEDSFLNECYAWNVWHDREGVYSIDYMDDEQLRDSILEDIFLVTFYEKEKAKKIHFTYNTLVRWLWLPPQLERVKKIFDTPEVQKYVIVDEQGMVRIRDDRRLQQEAMDLIGCWMDGFDIPDRAGIITINKEVLEEKIQEHGSIDNLAKALAMDVVATNESNKTVN